MKGQKRRAVFLDRDGVINRPHFNEEHVKSDPPRTVEEFEFLPGVLEACKRLKELGFLLVVVTNQPDVGRGIQSRESVEAIHRHMCEQFPFDLVQVCYESGREKKSKYRKPATGMVTEAAQKLNIDLKQSYLVGDRWRDIDCGHNAGCRTFFIDYKYKEALNHRPDFVVADLAEAVKIIEEQNGQAQSAA